MLVRTAEGKCEKTKSAVEQAKAAVVAAEKAAQEAQKGLVQAQPLVTERAKTLQATRPGCPSAVPSLSLEKYSDNKLAKRLLADLERLLSLVRQTFTPTWRLSSIVRLEVAPAQPLGTSHCIALADARSSTPQVAAVPDITAAPIYSRSRPCDGQESWSTVVRGGRTRTTSPRWSSRGVKSNVLVVPSA